MKNGDGKSGKAAVKAKSTGNSGRMPYADGAAVFLMLTMLAVFFIFPFSAYAGSVADVRHTVINGKSGWYYFKDGKYRKNFSGVVMTQIGLRRIKNGRIDFKAQGVYRHGSNRWLFRNGRVQYGYSGFYRNSWVISGGKVDKSVNGVYRAKNSLWIVRRGKVQKNRNGIYRYHKKYYRVKEGKLVKVLTKAELKHEKREEKFRKLIETASSGKNGKKIRVCGGYTMSRTVKNALLKGIRNITDRGYKVGFMMIDLNSGRGVMYNGDCRIYSASCIKGPFAASATALNPALARQWQSEILRVLHYSDNDAYRQLRRSFGTEYINEWCRRADVPTGITRYNYCDITARELCRLWIQNYKFFTESSWGAEVASWFESPNVSPIHTTLSWKTQTKAGWICERGLHAANDAGIVYAKGGTYVVAVLSDADARMSLLVPLIRALDQCHTDMVS